MSLLVKLAVTSVKQIFEVQFALYSPQHNKVCEINVFNAEIFSFAYSSRSFDATVP